ncbi:MAG: IS66 family insertion sequence element accessory protein TnpB [Desulfobacteraceae bacterium]|nr:IS66 family insertion sequence element accessory protein TnpB [Desulfobacteraceae bacterium]
MDKASWIERRKYWTDQVQRWKESGLTQREYCKKEDLSIERFGAWKRRLDHENQVETGGLVAVPSKIVSSALFTRPALGLVVDERYRVEIPDAFSPSTLEAVLQVLSRL